MGVDVGWGDEMGDAVGAGDFPAVVVHEHVVVSAEQDSAVCVRRAVVSNPVVDMVGFAPAGWSVAVAELAAAVAGGDGYCLSAAEESVFPAEVEDLALGVELDGDDPGGAGVSFDGGDGHRFGVTFDEPDPAPLTQVLGLLRVSVTPRFRPLLRPVWS